MVLGKIVGTVVANQKEATLDGMTLFLVAACDVRGEVVGSPVVAADAVGAGVGEIVLYASGSSARQTEITTNRPVDATIMAIVDAVEMNGEVCFRK